MNWGPRPPAPIAQPATTAGTRASVKARAADPRPPPALQDDRQGERDREAAEAGQPAVATRPATGPGGPSRSDQLVATGRRARADQPADEEPGGRSGRRARGRGAGRGQAPSGVEVGEVGRDGQAEAVEVELQRAEVDAGRDPRTPPGPRRAAGRPPRSPSRTGPGPRGRACPVISASIILPWPTYIATCWSPCQPQKRRSPGREVPSGTRTVSEYMRARVVGEEDPGRGVGQHDQARAVDAACATPRPRRRARRRR